MSDKPRRRHHKHVSDQPAGRRTRARRADVGLPGKVHQGAGAPLRSVSAWLKKAMRVLRRVLFRLIRKAVLFLMAQTGDASAGKAAAKKRISRKRFVLYAGSCLIVVVVVLLVLFVPSKAAVIPAIRSASPGLPGTPEMWQAAADNAIPTTKPDIAPVPTTPPDTAPTPTLKPTATPKPNPTATPTPKPTATPKPDPTATPKPKPTATPKPKPTATPKPKPTATPKPKPTATPKPTPTPAVNMAALVDFFVVSEGPYYEEGVYSSNHYDYTAEEFDILAKIIQREAGGESTAGKIAVGNVVINRVLCGRWGKTIDAVKGQFAYRPDTVPSKSVINAARAVLDDEVWKVPQNTYFFKTSGGSWNTYKLWGQIGNHYFYTANYSGRYNGDSVPAVLYERVYKYAQYGCKPEERVRRIQQMLKALGYSVNTDKKFDKTTEAALIAFQKDAGLSADGVAGPKTIEALIKKYGVEKYIKNYAS
jgi:spore germination cell wall hydrolase CwlJ-like protein